MCEVGSGGSMVRYLSPPPPSHRYRPPFSFFALIPPERGLFESLRVSIPVSKRRNGGFCSPVSAAKNSVPGSRFGDWFDDCVGSMQFGPDRLHHPISANRTFPIRRRIGRFCGDFRPLNSRIWSLWAVGAFWRRSLAPCLRIQKFRSRRAGLSTKFGQVRSQEAWYLRRQLSRQKPVRKW